MKRVLVTGAHGLLGQKIAQVFRRESECELLLTSRQVETFYSPRDFDYAGLDITHRTMVRDLVNSYRPDIIINCAAMADVDRCEVERERAWSVNVIGVQNIVDAAERTGATLIHVSTDYVFDGKNGPYDERARPNPANYYGKTKLASENTVLAAGIPFTIVRLMSLYGGGIGVKQNFLLRILAALRTGKPAYAPDDQWTNPTLASEGAYAILKIAERGKLGIYHLAGSEFLSRYAFALKIAEAFRFDPSLVQARLSEDLPDRAVRPKRSGFIILKAETELGIRFSDVSQGLTIVKRELGNHC